MECIVRREIVARGEKPPNRAAMLVHDTDASAVMSDSARALAEGRVDPIEVLELRPAHA